MKEWCKKLFGFCGECGGLFGTHYFSTHSRLNYEKYLKRKADKYRKVIIKLAEDSNKGR